MTIFSHMAHMLEKSSLPDEAPAKATDAAVLKVNQKSKITESHLKKTTRPMRGP